MKSLFQSARLINQPLNKWDVSAVTSFRNAFVIATFFNQPLNNWDTSGADDFENMFFGSLRFNQNITTWQTGEVTNMRQMFMLAGAFNHDISGWDVSSVTSFESMFAQTKRFQQNICWDGVLETTQIDISDFLAKNELGTYCGQRPPVNNDSPCGDCMTKAPFILFGGRELNCGWLTNQNNTDYLCETFDVVKEACPDTCSGKCGRDSNEKQIDFKCSNTLSITYCGDCDYAPFTQWGRSLNCNWLSKKKTKKREKICTTNQEANDSCPDTCLGECSRQDFSCDIAPIIAPVDTSPNECSDCVVTEFKLWNKKLNCKWLSKFDGNRKYKNREDLCNANPTINELCPDTCQGNCKKFVCIDSNDSSAPSSTPTIAAPKKTTCDDCRLTLLPLFNKELNCGWLSKSPKLAKICRKNKSAKKICPDTCKELCNGDSFSC